MLRVTTHAVRPPLMLQVIWMLQDFTENNRATMVMPGSQMLVAQPDAQRFRREEVMLTRMAGTAFMAHRLLWHDTSENVTGEPRVSLLINYGNKVIRQFDPRSARSRRKCLSVRPRSCASC
jgi:ectoine hydroxylase-related dioxygenase (phytanoyl-CoA dioxygenase family)